MVKFFYIFAGVNGSGKSTLYKTNFLNKNIKNCTRINTDEIVYSFGEEIGKIVLIKLKQEK